MTLPIAFLLGLAVVFGGRELIPPIPGNGGLEQLLPFAALLGLPSLLVACSSHWLRQNLIKGRRGRVPTRTMLRLSAIATPLVVWLLFAEGGYGDFVERWFGESHFATNLLLMLPVLATELPRIALGTATIAHCEIDDEIAGSRSVAREMLPRARELWPIVRVAMGWPLLLIMPLVLLGLLLDVLALDRNSYVFFLGTTVGSTLSTLAFLGIAAALLPSWFRIAFGVVRSLPEPVGTHLRRAATKLGFDPGRVLLLPTGMRAMNAMMVGPLRIGRFLCVTDGLVRALDAESLTGVVGHEVGHAKRGHPGLLMILVVLVPLLLTTPLQLLDLESIDATTKALVAVASVLVLLTVVRTLAHRFEHEADAASVQALGAAPCTRALMVLSQLAMPVSHGLFGRVLSLHPEEPLRRENMRRYESEPEFRAGFDARGRRLRLAVYGALALSFACAVVTWIGEWRFERVIWRFHSGDFVAAKQLMAETGPVPPRWERVWKQLREEVAAAAELAPEAEDWQTASKALREGAWRRGIEVLLSSGPAAARAWFSLAVEAGDPASELQRAVHDFCHAASEHDTERMHELKRALQRMEIPAELAPVFRE
ncbi:MAG TPA: M48 family metalloprotease [Planctomycetota bacterium]